MQTSLDSYASLFYGYKNVTKQLIHQKKQIVCQIKRKNDIFAGYQKRYVDRFRTRADLLAAFFCVILTEEVELTTMTKNGKVGTQT